MTATIEHAGRARAVRRLLAQGVPARAVRDALDVLAAQDDRDDPCRIEGQWSATCSLCGRQHPCEC